MSIDYEQVNSVALLLFLRLTHFKRFGSVFDTLEDLDADTILEKVSKISK